jgi:hypothetical protein
MSKRSVARRAPRIDPLGPPAVRQHVREGPTSVMRASWRDPDDLRPTAARSAREIAGFRSFCPLRWMLRRHGGATAITERHILAADRLRAAADITAYGFTGERELLPINAIAYGPRTQPAADFMVRSRARAELLRAIALFRADDRLLLVAVVLLNRSITAWVTEMRAAGGIGEPEVEMRRLIAVLDRLVEHYAAEIDDDLARGRVTAVL